MFLLMREQRVMTFAYVCNGNESALIIAMSRVAPVKQLTLPQTELMAAVTGVRLATHLQSALDFTNIVFLVRQLYSFALAYF